MLSERDGLQATAEPSAKIAASNSVKAISARTIRSD